jgi:pyrroline-5-carboxylate reductase
MKHTKIAIIGGGNLGQSILKGLLSKSEYLPKNITITKRNIDELEVFQKLGINVTPDNLVAVTESDIIILALKPYTVLTVLDEILPKLDPKRHELVSLASGVSLEQLNEAVQNKIPIYRAMPNTASKVGEAITCIATNTESINPNVLQRYWGLVELHMRCVLSEAWFKEVFRLVLIQKQPVKS